MFQLLTNFFHLGQHLGQQDKNCKSEELAKDLEMEVKKNSENIYEEWDWIKSDFKCVRDGNIVYFGHEDAVNIASQSNIEEM